MQGLRVLFFAVSGLLLLSGCNAREPQVVSVSGVVLYAGEEHASEQASERTPSPGQPVAEAKVTFHRNRRPIGFGTTDQLGRFRVKMYPERGEPLDGLAPGEYVVTIERVPLMPERASTAHHDATIPRRYVDPRTSPERRIVQLRTDQPGRPINYFQFRLVD